MITVIVMIILTSAVVLTGMNTPDNAQLVVFKTSVGNVQDAVTIKMLNNMINYQGKGKMQNG